MHFTVTIYLTIITKNVKRVFRQKKIDPHGRTDGRTDKAKT